MIRATKVLPSPSWTGNVEDTVVLDFDDRHRRRTAMTGVRGLTFLLDLPEAIMLRGGDALELEDGRLVEVVAAPEPLVEIKSRSPRDLIRLAWHIGNRHLPAQMMANALRIRRDHVIEDMLRGLGAKLVAIEAPFDPEGGAYAQGGHDSHTHEPEHVERHDHSDNHAHGRDHHHGHGHHHDHEHHNHEAHGDHSHEKSHKHEH